ncbi:MAG: hypothetical protein GXP09_11590 [Gammaproteobacteria bacterium]|nr:hypothetical protein [Gammaproteobacteria bacterium]
MKAKKQTPGPKPDRLKLDNIYWTDAIDKALEKKRPEEGWPKPEETKKN